MEIIDRLTLKCLLFNSPEDRTLTVLLDKCLSTGINDIDISEYGYLTICFNNGCRLRTWNLNKHYAWMHTGDIYNSSNECIYNWKDNRPSTRTLIEYKNATEPFEISIEGLLDKLK